MPSSLECECRASGTIERHSTSPLSSQARSLALPFSNSAPSAGRHADTSETGFIHLQLHSQVKCHHIPPRVLPPRLTPGRAARAGCAVGKTSGHWTDQIPNFSCPGPWRFFYPSHPWVFSRITSVPPRVPSPTVGTPARAPPAGPSSALRTDDAGSAP